MQGDFSEGKKSVFTILNSHCREFRQYLTEKSDQITNTYLYLQNIST